MLLIITAPAAPSGKLSFTYLGSSDIVKLPQEFSNRQEDIFRILSSTRKKSVNERELKNMHFRPACTYKQFTAVPEKNRMSAACRAHPSRFAQHVSIGVVFSGANPDIPAAEDGSGIGI